MSARIRGFTLVELMLVLVVVGILATLTAWQMGDFLVGNRVRAAARDFMVRIRSAAAIAARSNEPVDLVFRDSGTGCLPRYDIRMASGTVVDSVCISESYPGVALSAGPLASKPMVCTFDYAAGITPCTLCSGTRTIRFFPSGEVQTSGVQPEGDSVVFGPASGGSLKRTIGVSIRNVHGKVRVCEPDAAGTGWTCC